MKIRHLILATALLSLGAIAPAYAACVLVSTSRAVDVSREAPTSTLASRANDSIAYPYGDFAATTGGEEPWLVYADEDSGRACTP